MATLGVSIRRSEVDAVLIRRSKVAWSEHVVLERGTSIGEGMARLMTTFPKRHASRPRAVIAVGLAHCAIKRLSGLPPRVSARLLTRVVRENSASFFLRFHGRTAVSRVHRSADGSCWAAAFDADVLEGAVAVLRANGVARISAVPVPALGAGTLGTHRVTEDGISMELTFDAWGRMATGRRLLGRASAGDGRLESGHDGSRGMVTACAAAAATGMSVLIWRPDPEPARVKAIRRVGLGVACASLLVAAPAAVVTPGIRAAYVVSRAGSDARPASPGSDDLVRAQTELSQVRTELQRTARFVASRGEATILLRDLTAALPESTAVVSLRIDSLEGVLVLLGRNVADALPEFLSIGAIADPRIAGAVTRETQGPLTLERATVRFRRVPDTGGSGVHRSTQRGIR